MQKPDTGVRLSFARRKSTYLKHSKVSRGIVPNFQKYIWGVVLRLRRFGQTEGLDKKLLKVKIPSLSQRRREARHPRTRTTRLPGTGGGATEDQRRRAGMSDPHGRDYH